MRNLQFLVLSMALFSVSHFSYSDEILWSDEFDDIQLNEENWRQHYPGERFSGYNDISSLSTLDGRLTISVERRNGRNYTGMISTRGLKEINSGYLELRARFPDMPEGMKCSAILQSPAYGDKSVDPDLLPVNTGSVVTLFQLTAKQPKNIYSSVSWGDFSDNLQRKGGYSTVEINLAEFQVFGLNMLNDRYEFYLNGEKYLEVTDGISGVGMYIVLSCEIKDTLGFFDAVDSAHQFEIDYVRLMNSRPLNPIVPTGQLLEEHDWEVSEKSQFIFGNHDSDVGYERSQPDGETSLKVTLLEGSHLGADASYNFSGNVIEAWIAYCIRFSNTWTTQTGGKLPGFAGNSASFFSGGGQGGSPSNGRNSWSARMLYGKYNTETKSIPIGSYVYHTDQAQNGNYGDVDWWAPEPRRLVKDSVSLTHDKWYSIKQHIRMNTKEKNDGLIEGWVNDELVYRRDDFNFTNANRHRRVHRFWLDVYHGGSDTSPTDQHVYFDQFNFSIDEDTTSTHCN